MTKGLLIKDHVAKREYSTLLALISNNKGDYDICALVWDVCTKNYEEYLGETIIKRIERLKEVSIQSFNDFKRVVSKINQKYVVCGNKNRNEDTKIVLDEKGKPTFISCSFDANLIFEEIEYFYRSGAAA